MKKTVVTIGTAAVVIFTSTFTAAPMTVSAERNLQEVQTERKELREKLSSAEKEVASIMEEINEIDNEVKQLAEAINENEKQIKKAEKQIDKLEKDIAKLQEEIDELQAEIDERDEIIKNRIASHQANGGSIQLIEVFHGVKNFNDFISRASAMVTITNADAGIIEKQEEEKQKVFAKQKAIENKLNAQKEIKAEIEAIIETIEGQKADVEKDLKRQKDIEKKLRKKLNKLQLKDSDLARIEASLTTPAVVSASNGNSNGSSNSGSTQNVQSVGYSGAGGSALSAGSQFVGKSRYAYGVQNPSSGLFDCSGFVQWAYAQEGVSLPRSTGGMASVGTAISPAEMKPGDLVFFNTYKTNGHVGIYAGNGRFLGSQNSTGVAYADMNNSYWKGAFSGHVRRIK